MDFPIIIYDINNKIVSKSHITKTNCFYFRSYQNFDAEILYGTGALFSVVKKQNSEGINYLETTEAQHHENNFGYTLYIPENGTTVKIRLSKDNDSVDYVITLKDNNIIDETNEHYTDLLVNYNLPNYEQLSKALLEDFDKTELIKRLLLDFKSILYNKGTKSSIEKFLTFIGFNEKGLTVLDEYENIETGEKTLSPDKTKAIKTGNYHVLYDNYEETGLNIDNMPIRINHIDDLSVFFETLKYAISLANTYFTLEEQDIVFVGINYSSNVASRMTMTSTMNMIFEADPVGFRKDIHIFLTNVQKNITHFLVNNCLPKQTNLLKSEIKVIADNYDASKAINKIIREINDNNEVSNIDDFIRIFGVILNLQINCIDKYVEYFISQEGQVVYHFDKIFCPTNAGENFLAFSQSGNYTLLINITDNWNNTEQYEYNFEISKAFANVDFETFNSSLLVEGNGISLDVDSPTITNKELTGNYILPIELVPADLADYYNVANSPSFKQLTLNNKYFLQSINKNFKVDEITENIPVELTESWIEILSVPYSINTQVVIKVYDAKTSSHKIVELSELKNYDQIFDCLYVSTADIYNQETGETEPWYFIMTTEVGIELNKINFDLYLKSPRGEQYWDYTSLYTMPYQVMKLAVNNDFPLFPMTSQNAPFFIPYISETQYKKNIEGVEYPMVKTIFSRLINIEDDLADNSYELNLGDIVLCRLNQNFVVNEVNVEWQVINSFTKEVVYTTTNYMLKYRIEEQSIYDVVVNFEVGGQEYSITKPSLFSSFKSKLFK